MAKHGKPPANGFKKGKSGNPAGAPKRGESWAELIKNIGEYDGPAAANYAGFLSKQFNNLTPNVNLKTLVVLRVYASLIDDPQPGLFNALMERAEGKVKDQVEVSGSPNKPLVVKVIYDDAEPIDSEPTAPASSTS